jgi:spore coat protein JC
MYAAHGTGLFPSNCDGAPFTTAYLGVTGDYLADLSENLAAEEKARVTYEHLIDETNDPDVINVLLYLRQREIIHYNRFNDLLKSYKCMKK